MFLGSQESINAHHTTVYGRPSHQFCDKNAGLPLPYSHIHEDLGRAHIQQPMEHGMSSVPTLNSLLFWARRLETLQNIAPIECMHDDAPTFPARSGNRR